MRSAAILVGGRARRLGGVSKSTLQVAGRSIQERQLAVLQEAGVDQVAAIGPAPAPPHGVHPVADAVAGAGALGGLYTALLWAPTERVLVLAGDLPFLSAPFLRRLWDADAAADAVVPRTAAGWHPLAAVYHRRVAALLKTRIDRPALRITDALAAMRVTELGPADVAPFDPDGMLLCNVNTPDDYQHACRRAGAREDLSADARRAKADGSARS